MQLIEYIKSFLNDKKCDCLYVNHTNEFFSEYVDVKKSSRFLLTDFSGSTGDAIVYKDRIYLFVDSRYWEQAAAEVDDKFVEVVKIGLNYSFNDAIKNILPQGTRILFYQNKTSFYLWERFKQMGYVVSSTDVDAVAKYKNVKNNKLSTDFVKIPLSICAKSTDKKIAKIQKKLNCGEVCIVSSLEDVSYLLNMRADIFEYSSVIFGKIIIEKDGFKFFTDENEFEKSLKSICDKYKNAKFYIDKSTLSIKYEKYLKNYDDAKFLSTLRSVKYQSEIDYMQKCFEQTDMVISDTINALNTREYKEREMFDFVNESFKKHNAVTNSFTTILASGKNSSVVHFSHPTERQIKDGDFVLLDCGGLYSGGYATDITRTFVKGEPDNEQKKVYTTVLKAFLNAYNADLSKCKTFYEIDKIARDIIDNANMPEFNFGHGLGHSVGRCVHDGLPTLSPSVYAKMKIKKNMVFTIEPGMYKPNWGGVRLENTVHTVKIGDKLVIKSFSKAPFQKSLIDFSMLSDLEKKYLKEWNLV